MNYLEKKRPGAKKNELFLKKMNLHDKKQEKEKVGAQQFTKERDKSMEELSDWIYEFSVAAKFALAEKPQLLEKPGIKVDS